MATRSSTRNTNRGQQTTSDRPPLPMSKYNDMLSATGAWTAVEALQGVLTGGIMDSRGQRVSSSQVSAHQEGGPLHHRWPREGPNRKSPRSAQDPPDSQTLTADWTCLRATTLRHGLHLAHDDVEGRFPHCQRGRRKGRNKLGQEAL
jgi:hypothetical protein